jgi:hypothetical protein
VEGGGASACACLAKASVQRFRLWCSALAPVMPECGHNLCHISGKFVPRSAALSTFLLVHPQGLNNAPSSSFVIFHQSDLIPPLLNVPSGSRNLTLFRSQTCLTSARHSPTIRNRIYVRNYYLYTHKRSCMHPIC